VLLDCPLPFTPIWWVMVLALAHREALELGRFYDITASIPLDRQQSDSSCLTFMIDQVSL
jgi:hypothetical protein